MHKYLRVRRPIVFQGRILPVLTIFSAPLHLATEFVKYKLCDYYEPDETTGNPYGQVTTQSVEVIDVLAEIEAKIEAPKKKARKKKEAE